MLVLDSRLFQRDGREAWRQFVLQVRCSRHLRTAYWSVFPPILDSEKREHSFPCSRFVIESVQRFSFSSFFALSFRFPTVQLVVACIPSTIHEKGVTGGTVTTTCRLDSAPWKEANSFLARIPILTPITRKGPRWPCSLTAFCIESLSSSLANIPNLRSLLF